MSLRNRFWLEQLGAFVECAEDPVFVNIGAGLTSYPYLLRGPVSALEFDRPSVADYKEARARDLQGNGTLPARAVAFHGVDLGADLDRLETRLSSVCADRSSFVLCEGLLYYLDRSAVADLVEVVRSVQRTGSVLGLDYWSPSVAGTPVFRRMRAFFAQRLGMTNREYTFLEESWVASLDGYEILDLTDVARVEASYTGTSHLQDPDLVLLESYATLKRS